MTVVGAAALHLGVGCTVNVAVCLRLALRSIVGGTVSMHPTVFRLWPAASASAATASMSFTSASAASSSIASSVRLAVVVDLGLESGNSGHE